MFCLVGSECKVLLCGGGKEEGGLLNTNWGGRVIVQLWQPCYSIVPRIYFNSEVHGVHSSSFSLKVYSMILFFTTLNQTQYNSKMVLYISSSLGMPLLPISTPTSSQLLHQFELRKALIS